MVDPLDRTWVHKLVYARHSLLTVMYAHVSKDTDGEWARAGGSRNKRKYFTPAPFGISALVIIPDYNKEVQGQLSAQLEYTINFSHTNSVWLCTSFQAADLWPPHDDWSQHYFFSEIINYNQSNIKAPYATRCVILEHYFW